MAIASATQEQVLALREMTYKALGYIDTLASGAQMPGEAIADNTDYAAEIDAAFEELETAVAAVNAAA